MPMHHGYTPAQYGAPNYGVTPAPYPAYGYGASPRYPLAQHSKSYHQPAAPAAYHMPTKYDQHPPLCAKNTTAIGSSWCLYDNEYPTYDVQHAIEYHYAAVAALYKDVIANTDNSVDRLKHPDDETYLCHSASSYATPLRAVNVEGKWRVIVNGVKAHYETLSQTARIEECLNPGYPCPLVPECYNTKCLQKYVYHRFLIYDSHDYYFPFSIESFKLPSSCACYNGAFEDYYK
jgi:hypothetical protein